MPVSKHQIYPYKLADVLDETVFNADADLVRVVNESLSDEAFLALNKLLKLIDYKIIRKIK